MLMAIMMAAANSADECKGSQFCIAEQRLEAAQSELDHVVELARDAARNERASFAKAVEEGFTSTLEADEVEALTVSSVLWRESMEADCVLVATMFKQAGMSTMPHTQNLICQTERTRARIAFLKNRYGLDESAQ